MDDHAADTACCPESHVRPGLAGVGRLVHTIAHGDVRTDVRFAGADPDDGRIRHRHRQRARGVCVLLVEDRPPDDPSVGRLPDAAARRAGVVREGIPHHARNRRESVSDGTDMPERQRAERIGRDLLRRQRIQGRDQRDQHGGTNAREMEHTH